jgi:DNA-binding GntR family transcriptional regulator
MPELVHTTGDMPRRHVLTDEVYEHIKAMLMDHVIEPGARISIDGLARELDVSPTPVRETLARLESEGLAVKSPLKGYRATELLTLAEFEDLFQFRRLVEPWAARSAATKVDEEGCLALRAELASVTAPTTASYDEYKSLTAHDARFHSLVARLSGSEQVRAALERTHCHLHIFRLYYTREAGPDALAEHRAIADAVIAGDGDAAEAAMVRHLDAAMLQRLKKVYDQAQETGST